MDCTESWRELGRRPADTLWFALGRSGGVTAHAKKVYQRYKNTCEKFEESHRWSHHASKHCSPSTKSASLRNCHDLDLAVKHETSQRESRSTNSWRKGTPLVSSKSKVEVEPSKEECHGGRLTNAFFEKSK